MSHLCLSLDGFRGHYLIPWVVRVVTLMGTEGFIKGGMCVHLNSSPA